jgi:hypothetical protein
MTTTELYRAREKYWLWGRRVKSENERKAGELATKFRGQHAKALRWSAFVGRLSLLLLKGGSHKPEAWVEERGSVRFTHSERAEWVELVLADFKGSPERTQRCREILLGHPLNTEEALLDVMYGLVTECQRHELVLAQGITKFDEIDTYLCGLEDDGYILDQVPWVVLKANYRGGLLTSEYRRLKQKVLETNPSNRKELDELLCKLFKESRQRRVEFCSEDHDPSSEEQRMYQEETQAVADRIFEIENPEFVTRIPGQPPFLDRSARYASDEPGPIILHIAQNNPSGFRRFTNYLGHCLYLLAGFLDERLGLKKHRG